MGGQISNETQTAKLRLFIALQVPEAVKAQIQLAQDEFRRALPPSCARWTRPEQWHLTLKFLGNVDAGRLDALTEAVREVCEKFALLKLCAERIGCFPDLRRPRVIWVGVQDENCPSLDSRIEPQNLVGTRSTASPSLREDVWDAGGTHPFQIQGEVHEERNELATLAEAIKKATAEFTSEAREGKFTGHITIARVNKIKRPEAEHLARLAQSMSQREFGTWTAAAIEIMRSDLAAGGAKHTCLARLPLSGLV